MKIKGDVFQNKRVKELFESEGYTTDEWKNMMKAGAMLKSRMYERMAYILRDGKINILNLR